MRTGVHVFASCGSYSATVAIARVQSASIARAAISSAHIKKHAGFARSKKSTKTSSANASSNNLRDSSGPLVMIGPSPGTCGSARNRKLSTARVANSCANVVRPSVSNRSHDSSIESSDLSSGGSERSTRSIGLSPRPSTGCSGAPNRARFHTTNGIPPVIAA